VTLIELVAFIVIMGISVIALLSMYRAVLPRGATPAQITMATQLAQERMELLLGQRDAFGYSTAVLTDPCAGGTPPAVCTNQFTPSGQYSIIVTGVSPPVQWSGFSVDIHRMLGVRVLGPDGNQLAGLSAVIGNY
jgi:Tfp pilus assembly protein PilV